MKSILLLLGITIFSNGAFAAPKCTEGGGWQACGNGSTRSFCSRNSNANSNSITSGCTDGASSWQTNPPTVRNCCGTAIAPPLNPVTAPRTK